MKTERTDTCPTCGYEFECVSLLCSDVRKMPEPGDYSICLKCGETLVFTDTGVRVTDLNDMMKLGNADSFLMSEAQRLIREHRWVK